MMITALMPTYRRRQTVQNALACFLAQTHTNKHLLIVDESGEFPSQTGENWECIALPPFPSLAAKYDWMAEMAFSHGAEAIAVMEDDDIYAPRYLEYHAQNLYSGGVQWSHPSSVWVDGTGGGPTKTWYIEKNLHGNMHAATAMTREMYYKINGWQTLNNYGFDTHLLGKLNAVQPPKDPTIDGPPQYYFRWASTGLPHGESYQGDNWINDARAAYDAVLGPQMPGPLRPCYDNETALLVKRWRAELPGYNRET